MRSYFVFPNEVWQSTRWNSGRALGGADWTNNLRSVIGPPKTNKKHLMNFVHDVNRNSGFQVVKRSSLIFMGFEHASCILFAKSEVSLNSNSLLVKEFSSKWPAFFLHLFPQRSLYYSHHSAALRVTITSPARIYQRLAQLPLHWSYLRWVRLQERRWSACWQHVVLPQWS